MNQPYSVYISLFLIGLLIFTGACSSSSPNTAEIENNEEQPVPDFSRAFGGSNDDLGKSILETADGGLLISGTTTSVDGDFSGLSRGNRDIFAIKLTSSGSRVFLFTYGGTNSDWAMNAAEDESGNLYITGYSRSDDQQFSEMNRGENDLFLVKTTPDGALVWAKTYGGTGEDYGYDLEIIDSHVYIAGATRSSDGTIHDKSGNDLDILVLKTDLNGELQWSRTFGSSGNDTALSISGGRDNRFAVTGSFERGDGLFDGSVAGLNGMFILELSTEGTEPRLKTVSGSNSDTGQSIHTADEGGYIVAGTTDSGDGDFGQTPSGGKDGFLLKINNRFETEWIRRTGGSESDEIFTVFPAGNNSWVAVGETRSSDIFSDAPPFGGLNAFATLVAPDGSLLKSQYIGGSRSDIASDATSLMSGELAISGWTLSNDGPFSGPLKAGRDAYVIKVSADHLEILPFN